MTPIHDQAWAYTGTANAALVEAETKLMALVVQDAQVQAQMSKLMIRERSLRGYMFPRLPEENRARYEELQRSRPPLGVQVPGIPGHHVSAIYPQNRTAWKNHGTRTVYRVHGVRVSRERMVQALASALAAEDAT